MILPETAGQKLLVDHGRVVGVRTGDKGRGKDGRAARRTSSPAPTSRAKVTVLAEGTAGPPDDRRDRPLRPPGRNPQIWALGVKEVWKVARPLHRIVHTMGWPLRKSARYGEFGGSWIYPMGDEHVSIGFVVGLEYADVELSAHDLLQEFKTHRLVRKILEGGERVAWGAKTITEGGLHSVPREAQRARPHARRRERGARQRAARSRASTTRSSPGGSPPRRRSRRCSAARSRDAAARSTATTTPSARATSGRSSREVRNMRQAFDKGFFVGGALASAMTVTKGKLPPKDYATHPQRRRARSIRTGRAARYPAPDGKLTFDKLSSVFASGNRTRDDQPSHIRIADERAARPRGDVAVDVPGARLRGRGGRRGGHGPGRREPVELRPVRRDHAPRAAG